MSERYRLGCEDCGRVWDAKVDVPTECRGYVLYVVADENSAYGYVWADADPPEWN